MVGNRTGGTYNENNELRVNATATYTYDANGNTLTKTVGAQVTVYAYDVRDRLAQVTLPDGRIAAYTYDPFGRRIRKDFAGVVTHYLYSDEGLIGEYAADGSNNKAYTWRPDGIWGTNPVTQIAGGTTYYYQNDHLGTPQKMFDEQGNVVWSTAYSAFGQATVSPAPTVENNLRFPGQYFDAETGLHYNWNRYYDAETGRYVSVDPIGFGAGDANLYRYVGNGPATLIDPDGLRPSRGSRYIHPQYNPYIEIEALMLLNAIREIQPNYRATASLRATGSPRFNRNDVEHFRNYYLNLITPASSGQCPLQSSGNVARDPLHHIFSQRADLAAEFLARGINPHLQTMRIPLSIHKQIHRGGPRGGRWNQAWEDFFRANPGATDIDVYKEAGRLIYEFQLPAGPIVPYRR